MSRCLARMCHCSVALVVSRAPHVKHKCFVLLEVEVGGPVLVEGGGWPILVVEVGGPVLVE